MKLTVKKLTAWLSVPVIIISLGITAFAEGENDPSLVNTDAPAVTDTSGVQQTAPLENPTADSTQNPTPGDTSAVEPQPTPLPEDFDPFSKAGYLVSTDIKLAPLPSDTAQTVNVTVNVKALDALTPIRNITLYLGDLSQPVTEVFTQPVTADNLEGVNIIFPVYLQAWQFGTDIGIWAEYTYDVQDPETGVPEAKVAKKHLAGNLRVDVAENKYAFTVTPDKTIVRENGDITYTVELTNNSGDFIPVGSLITFAGTYSDGTLFQSEIPSIDISGLTAGQTATFTFQCKTILKDFTVTPTLVIGPESLPQEPVTVVLKNASAQVILEIIGPHGVQFNGKAVIKYTVINTGNVALKNIEMYDDNYNAKSFPVTELAIGQSVSASTRVQITKDTTLKYKLMAYDEFGDKLPTVSSNSVNVMLVTSVDDIVLSIKATVKGSSVITEAQRVPFEVTVTNNSGVAVNNLVIYDINGDEVWSIYSLGVNKSETFTVPFEITSSQNVSFKVVAADQNGTTVEFESNYVPITLDGTTPKPVESTQPTQQITVPPTQAPTAESTQPIEQTDNTQLMIMLLCVVGGVIIIGIILLIIISSLQKRAARKRRRITRRVR